MGTNLVAKPGNAKFVDNRVNERAIENEQGVGGVVYPMAFYHGKQTSVDTLGRTSKPSENRHLPPLSTFFLLKLKKEEIEKEEGSLPESFEPKVDVDEAITTDLSTHDLTQTLPAIAKFWTDALIHDRATMRTRWADYRGVVPDALAGAIVSDVEHVRSTSSQFVSFEGGR